MPDLKLALQGDRTDDSSGQLQIAKLLIIPFVCGVESVWLGKVFSRSVIASIFTVVAGVAIVYAPSPDFSIIPACSARSGMYALDFVHGKDKQNHVVEVIRCIGHS